MLFNPLLPIPEDCMSYKDLRKFRANQKAEFFQVALKYSNYLWKKGLPARALLAMDRALFADIQSMAKVFIDWELPYSALVWYLTNLQSSKFMGNPRIHYQHLADRLRGDRENVKKWRSWACWYLSCKACPNLKPDVNHIFNEPSLVRIKKELNQHGIQEDLIHFENALKIL